MGWKEWKAKHWDRQVVSEDKNGDVRFMPLVVTPPLRRVARAMGGWLAVQGKHHAPAWVAAIGTVGAAWIALISYLQRCS